MPTEDVAVLLEDNHLLAVDKPAGMPSQADETGDPSLVDWAAEYVRVRYAKPGNVFVGLVHRLDRPVSGVTLLARTSKAAARLSEQFRAGLVQKTYWAIAEGKVVPSEGEWVDWLAKDVVRNIVEVVAPEVRAAKQARVIYRVLETGRGWSFVELCPGTGRSHQLRVQLASRGWPIVGDRKYGARTQLAARAGGWRIALHAYRLGFTHPTRKEWIELRASEPADWPDLR